MDRHARRPDLRFALAAARLQRSLRLLGLEGEVREGLRGGVDQGDESRPLRPRLISADRTARAFRAQPRLIEAAQVLRSPSTEAKAFDKKSGRRCKQVQTPPWTLTTRWPQRRVPVAFFPLKSFNDRPNRVSHVDRSQDRAEVFVKFLPLTSAGEWNCAVAVQHDKSILQLRYPIGGSSSP